MYYYYDKDHYGKEHCYEVADEDLRSDKEDTLQKVAGDTEVPIWHVESWNDFDWDPDDEYDRWTVKAITDFLTSGRILPVIMVTHLTSKADEKYECFNCEDEIDYDELIHEYAGPHDYKIGPVYIKEDEYTVEQAEKEHMYALAKRLREKTEEVDEKVSRKDKFIQDLNAVDTSQPPEEVYQELFNLAWEYQRETKRWNLEIPFDGFITDEAAQALLQSKLNNFNEAWWLVCCIEHTENVYRLNEYNQLLNLDREDVDLLREDIIEYLDD